jgi:hypothetical protein
MSQRQWVVIIGVWVAVFLFLGLPSSWEKVLSLLTGLLIIVMAYRIRLKEKQPGNGAPFADNVPGKPAAVPQDPAHSS